jgi:Family of unknown function (DUF6325)
MGDEPLDDIGPIDYVLIEFPGSQFNGEVLPELAALADRGIVRIIDLLFVKKEDDGSFEGFHYADLMGEIPELEIFEGVSAGILSQEDAESAAAAMEPGTSAGLIVYENRWAAHFAGAVRRSGGQLVAHGRIPLEDILDALDAVEAAS